MPKLQQIKRANGTYSHSINIPIEMIQRMHWNKSDSIFIECEEIKYLEGEYRLIIYRE